jgi:hypothetical protein
MRSSLVRVFLLIGVLLAANLSVSSSTEQRSGGETPSGFDEGVADQVLSTLSEGLETQDERLILSVFDPDKMPGYGAFASQIHTLLDQYDNFRVRYRIRDTALQGERGIVLIDLQLEATSSDDSETPVRNNAQVRVEFERAGKAWKIVDFQPRQLLP